MCLENIISWTYRKEQDPELGLGKRRNLKLMDDMNVAGAFHACFSFAFPTSLPPGFPEKLKYVWEHKSRTVSHLF